MNIKIPQKQLDI